jgi:hypothetical protein
MGTWNETYIILAIAIDATLSDAVDDYVHLKEARTVILNLTSSGLGTEASTLFLQDIDWLVRKSRLWFKYEDHRRIFVKKVNDFTIRHFGDLPTFVNALPWPDGCIPFYWAQISDDGGADVLAWNTCYS